MADRFRTLVRGSWLACFLDSFCSLAITFGADGGLLAGVFSQVADQGSAADFALYAHGDGGCGGGVPYS